MKNLKSQTAVLLLILVVLMVGCTPATAPNENPSEGIAVGEPNPSAPDPTAGTSPKMGEEAAKAMAFDKTIEDIVSITLRDLEGNTIDRTFNEKELKEIQQAFNDSFIMDTAYIEMITGYSMTIGLKDGREVFITSYGEPSYIVAQLGDQTYHLGCERIGNILLEEIK